MSALRRHAGSFASGLVGVVVGAALFGGVSYAANGGSFLLGKANAETATATLTDTAGTPLSLVAKSGFAPLKVNSKTKVVNLNADSLDGLDSTMFLRSTGTAANANKLSGLTAAQIAAQGALCSGFPHRGIDWSVPGSTPGHGCDLSWANLVQANFQYANLTNAKMPHVFMEFALLTHANLSGADLSFAIADKISMAFGNMSGADLTSANLVQSGMGGSDFSGANLTSADLTDASLRDLVGPSGLVHSNLTGANLTGANLTGTDLTGATMTGATLTSVIWSNTICPDGQLSSVNVPETCVGQGA